MAILKRFLCIFNTRTGSLISGCYTLAISLLCLVYFLFRYVGHQLVEDSTEYKGIIYVGFVLYGFMIVSSLVIIPGVQLDKRYLLLPWIYIVILVVLYDTGSVALLTTVHMEREKTLHVWEIIWLFFYLFRLAANCYCFTCVVSQYQELSDGRGTYDYLYKPRRRARLRHLGEFDIDTIDLPFGVHLPPYTPEDNTENSPPLYSQIYPATEESSPEYDIVEYQQRLAESDSSPRSSGANNYQTIQIQRGNISCTENCPYCLQALENSSNYTYRRRELQNYSARLQENSAVLISDQFQSRQNLTLCPVLVHNESSDENGDSEIIQTHPASIEQCNSMNTRQSSRNDTPQCYEVTVNVEWI